MRSAIKLAQIAYVSALLILHGIAALARDTRPMIRPVLTEVALFLAPFAIYVIFLLATRAGVLHPDSWSLPRLAWLVIAALVLMIGSFLVLSQFSGAPPGSTYVPAHIEDGHFVPGETK
jgi:hypothetical protein